MSKNESGDVFELVEGMKKVDPDKLAEYERKMKEEVVPEIVRIVEKRRLFAAEGRFRQLKRSPFTVRGAS